MKPREGVSMGDGEGSMSRFGRGGRMTSTRQRDAVLGMLPREGVKLRLSKTVLVMTGISRSNSFRPRSADPLGVTTWSERESRGWRLAIRRGEGDQGDEPTRLGRDGKMLE
jgi:hypothetical protein